MCLHPIVPVGQQLTSSLAAFQTAALLKMKCRLSRGNQSPAQQTIHWTAQAWSPKCLAPLCGLHPVAELQKRMIDYSFSYALSFLGWIFHWFFLEGFSPSSNFTFFPPSYYKILGLFIHFVIPSLFAMCSLSLTFVLQMLSFALLYTPTL